MEAKPHMVDLKRLFNDLIRFEIEIWDGIDARLRAESGLTMGSFDHLQVIARTPACRVQDIARELSITVGGTSKVVDRIVAAGHCRRRPNPDDRRSSIIELTAAGAAVLAGATTIFEEELELRLGSVLSARALEQFSAALTKLRSAGARGAAEPTSKGTPR